jgi:hypothetical protein
MSNVKESFDNFNSNTIRYFVNFDNDTSYNYYKLNTTRYKYKLETLPSGLILENSNNLINTDTRLRTRDLNNNREKNILLSYYNTETDISLLNIRASTTIMLDISTVPTTDPSNSKTMNMVFIENSGNFYDLSNQKLSKFIMRINGEVIIKNGEIYRLPGPPTPTPTTTPQTPSNFYNDFNLYLLRQGAFGSNYIPPIYNNFETAMNLPSNPIVNPVNSMNPLQYAESLFGPNITPVMAKNAYLNQNVDSAATVESSNNAMKAIRSPAPSFDTNGNLLAQNSSANVSSNRVNSSKNIATEDYPPCPAPQRCPEPNFDCKKVPKYEQGPENPFLPRPVLTDFSTFGM